MEDLKSVLTFAVGMFFTILGIGLAAILLAVIARYLFGAA